MNASYAFVRAAAPPLLGLAVALSLLHAPALEAQPREAARIEGILDVLDGARSRALPGPTRRVLVRRSDSDDWLDGREALALFWADQVMVEPRTLVRLGLSAGDARGTAHLSPDLQAREGGLVLDEIGGNERALYAIREVPNELGDLELLVARGSLALDWTRGRLALFAAGVRAVVAGTRLVLTVDAEGERGALHLVEGRVTFPDFPGVTLAPGQTALLRAGLPPAVQPQPADAARRLADAAQWSAEDAWPRPFYRQPWAIYGGVAAIAAGGLLLMRASDDDPSRGGTRSGVVILRFPF